MQLPKELTRDLVRRLRNVEGQIRGLIRLLEQDSSPEALLQQMKATRGALKAAETELQDEVFRKALALKMVRTAEACPGNCGRENQIRELFQLFPHLSSQELPQKLLLADALEKFLTSEASSESPIGGAGEC